jgi:hypothetical protein
VEQARLIVRAEREEEVRSLVRVQHREAFKPLLGIQDRVGVEQRVGGERVGRARRQETAFSGATTATAG